jgi:thiamine-phosphate pyrophosphorylase
MNLASEIHEITVRSNTPLIVNDHAEVAARVPVEGVHVGQEDDSIPVARQKAGRDLIVGKSTHSLDQAHAAQGEGADYIGFGPIFATPSKAQYGAPLGIDVLAAVATLPVVAIGGITAESAAAVRHAGAAGVAVVRAILDAADPGAAAAALVEAVACQPSPLTVR